MLLESLVAIHLPVEDGPATHSSLKAKVEALLGPFFGPKRAVYSAWSAGRVLAALYGQLRACDAQGTFRIPTQLGDYFEHLQAQPIDEDLALFPKGWAEGMEDLILHFDGQAWGLDYTISAHFSQRVPHSSPHLILNMRSVFTDYLPELQGGSAEPDYSAHIQWLLEPPRAFKTLQRAQRERAARILAPLQGHFEGATHHPTHLKHRFFIVSNPEHYPDLVGPLGKGAALYLRATAQAFHQLRPETEGVFIQGEDHFQAQGIAFWQRFDPALRPPTERHRPQIESGGWMLWRGQDPMGVRP